MIGRVRGKLLDKQPPILLVDVGGIGYEIEAPMSVFFNLPATGSEVTLLTHLLVKEDAHTLFGFDSEGQRQLFRRLIRISGIGAKLALVILSGMSADELAQVVANSDVTALTGLPGIGKKTAERLIVELRDKLDGLPAGGAPTAGAVSSTQSSPTSEARQALLSLGYKAQECQRMINAVARDDMSAEEIIREALKSKVKNSNAR